MRALKNTNKIDAGDPNTMRYEKECRAHLTANGKEKPKEKRPGKLSERQRSDHSSGKIYE
ncbi:MAG: hypothetical protein V8R46_08450 [Eubacterium ramulus]